MAELPFFSEKISFVSFSVSFYRLFHRALEGNTWKGRKAPLYTPPWARASAKPLQSHCYAWLFNQKTGSWASACRDHLKSITMLFFCYVITAVNWQQKHFSDISRTVNLLVIDFFERIVGYYNVWRPVLSGHIKHNTYLLGFFLSSALWRLVVP